MPVPLPPLTAPLPAHPVLVGYSGGLDSTLLLHLLAASAAQRAAGLRALHVHHGLQRDADQWVRHCQATCDALGIELLVCHVQVPRNAGNGPEGAARDARHAAFSAQLRPGETLALAHHLDDQAETFLLRALRGSGSDGLAAMQAHRAYGHGQLWRPLLQYRRAELLAHAQAHGLRWIEDPSNQRDEADRNFLRLHVMPLLQQRWPHAAQALARSAALAGESTALLQAQDRADLPGCQLAPDVLSISALLALPSARRARLLRHWVRTLGYPALPGNGVRAIESLLGGEHDRASAFRWQHVQLRRWRDQLHALPLTTGWPAQWHSSWDGSAPLALPDGRQLHLVGSAGFAEPLQVSARRGGERITLPGRAHSHALKDLLHQQAMPPWQRAQLPLLMRDNTLLAAGDQIIAAELQAWLSQHGARLQLLPATDAN